MTEEVPACEPEPAPSAQPIPAPEAREEPMSCQSAAEEEGAGRSLQESAKKKLPRPVLVGIGVVLLLAIVALIASCFICTHKTWIEATCTEPRTCAECGKTEGEPLGHEWQEATCTEPRMCIWCDATEGEPLGHTEGEWEYGAIDFSDAEREKTRECTVCGEVIDSETEVVESFVENGRFLFSPEQFFDLFGAKLDLVSYIQLHDESDSDLIAYTMREGGEKIGLVAFAVDGDSVGSSHASKGNQDYQIIVLIPDGTNSGEYVACSIVSLIRACDPSQDLDSAKEIGSELIDDEEIVENGIKYIFYEDSDGDYWIEATGA